MSEFRISRRRFGIGLGAAALIGPAIAASAQAAPDLSGVTLRVGDQTGATRAKLEAAGLLNDLPYQLEWSVYAAAVNLHEALKAGATDIGSSSDAPAVSAIAGGSKIKVVGAWSNEGRGTLLLVQKDSAIQSLEDLRGKVISPTTRGSVAHFLVVNALKRANIPESEVKLAFLTPTDAAAAFQSGDIDAWGTWGIFAARTVGTLGARTLATGENGLTTGLNLYSATDATLEDPGKVAAASDFLRRWDQGFDWTRANEEAWVDYYAAFSKQDRDLSRKLYADDAAYRKLPTDAALGAQLQQTFDTWKQAGVLSGDLDLAGYVREGLI